MSPAGWLASLTGEGAAHTEAFLTDLDELRCPALRPGQTVLRDHRRVPQVDAVRERLEACGCRRVFFPRYRPEFNPMEGAFSKLKAFLRRVQARTHEALEAALGAGLQTISAQDAQGWFKHCGYSQKAQPS